MTVWIWSRSGSAIGSLKLFHSPKDSVIYCFISAWTCAKIKQSISSQIHSLFRSLPFPDRCQCWDLEERLRPEFRRVWILQICPFPGIPHLPPLSPCISTKYTVLPLLRLLRKVHHVFDYCLAVSWVFGFLLLSRLCVLFFLELLPSKYQMGTKYGGKHGGRMRCGPQRRKRALAP